jgi:ATP-dependent RNA helicase DeaD
MEQFKQGICPVLIASDVAARGIDVDDIDLVVNYDIPQDFEYYIHRVGRTGRAGKKGLAITLIHGQRQRYQIRDLTRYTKTEISRRKLPSSKMMERANRNAYIAKVKELCDIGITEESLEVANALMAEGIALENLLSALISMSYKNELIDIEDDEVKKYASDFEAVTLKFSLGRMDGIQQGNIIAAVIEECGISKNAIGKIEVFKNFTLVSISADKVDIVLNNMQGAKVRKKEVQVELDQPPKRKNKQNDKKVNDKKTSDKKGSEKEASKPKKERRNKQEATGRRARNRKEKTRSIRKSKKK